MPDLAAVAAGSEAGVELCTRLAEDLGLPGNPVQYLGAMTRKDEIHQALKNAGIRHIRGEKVRSPGETLDFCRKNGLSAAVVKPLQSAGSQGLFLCDSPEEAEAAVRTLLNMKDLFGRPIREAKLAAFPIAHSPDHF